VIYPGSFDPITLGHVDIIQRVHPFFEELTVLVAHSGEKKYLFSAEERKELIEKSIGSLPNVKIDIFEGLTTDYLKRNGQKVIIRGLRAVADFENELVMANMNKKLAKDVETMIVFANPEFHYISSRLIKEVAAHGGTLLDVVPTVVVEALKRKLKKK